jgi:hypothetical protein
MSKERNADSINDMAERKAKIREEAERIEREQAAAEERRQEKQAVRDMKIEDDDADMLERHANRLSDLGTRDQLLERVREMRLETTGNAQPPPSPMTEFQKQQLEIEQQAGREAVAKAEKLREETRVQREKMAAETKAREGHMAEVHHPNPGQDEQYPGNRATLGKPK